MEGESRTVEDVMIPSSADEVTAQWLSKVLKAEVDPSSFEVTGNVNAGLGFLSNLIGVKFSTNDVQNKTSIMVKLLPPKQFEAERNLVIAEKMDKSEICFYQILLPELLKEVPTLEPYTCPFFYGKIQKENLEKDIEYASVLILKDLKDDSFGPKPYAKGPLNEREINLVLDFFSQFHASAMLHEAELEKRLPEVYDFFPKWYYPQEIGSKQFVIHAWFQNSFEPIIKMLGDYATNTDPKEKERGEDLISNMLRPLAPYGQKIFDRVLEGGQKYPTALHGDLWQNNILTSTNESNPAIKAIDWQLMGYGDPVFDLGVFLISTGVGNLTYSNFERWAKLYFDKVENILQEKISKGLKCGSIKRRSWEEFWNAFKTYGISFSFIFIMLSLETFVQHEGFLPKFYQALVFLHSEMKLSEFLINLIAD